MSVISICDCLFLLQPEKGQEFMTQRISTIRMMYDQVAAEYEVSIPPS